jgi:hypothetical protein
MKNFLARVTLIGINLLLAVPLLIIQSVYIIFKFIAFGKTDTYNVWFQNISEWIVERIFKVDIDDILI